MGDNGNGQGKDLRNSLIAYPCVFTHQGHVTNVLMLAWPFARCIPAQTIKKNHSEKKDLLFHPYTYIYIIQLGQYTERTV